MKKLIQKLAFNHTKDCNVISNPLCESPHNAEISRSSTRISFAAALRIAFVVSILATLMFLPEIASAQTTGTDVLNNTYAKITGLFTVVMNFISVLLWPILLMIGGLIQNDIIFGGGMEDRLLLVWREVRNIVNIFFVIGLVGLAFYNVLGVGDDKIKSVLPKLIIAIIAVNFTFLAGKVVLDVANVVTVSLFAIPQSIDPDSANVMPKDSATSKLLQERICTSLYDPVYGASDGYIREKLRIQAKVDAAKKLPGGGATAIDKEATTLFGQYNSATSAQWIKVQNGLFCKKKEFDFSKATNASGQTVDADKKQYFFQLFNKFDANNAALTMAINLQKVYDIKKANFPQSFKDLTIHVLFSVVLFIIYGSAYVALFAVLIVRVVVIWICLIFSPILIFSTKIGSPSIPGVSDLADKLYEAFINHVKAPIIIAAVLSVGYIMLKAFQGGNPSSPLFNLQTDSFSLATPGLLTFNEILLAIATCVVVWMGVFAAANDTLAKGFTEGLQSTLGGIGKFLLKSPLYLPLVPIRKPGEKGNQEPVPIAAALGAVTGLKQKIESDAYSKSKDLLKAFGISGATASTPVEGLVNNAKGNNRQEFLGYVKQVGKAGISNITATQGKELVNTQVWKNFVSKVNKGDRDALNSALISGQGIQSNQKALNAWREAYRLNNADSAYNVQTGNTANNKKTTTPPPIPPNNYENLNTSTLSKSTINALTQQEQQLLKRLADSKDRTKFINNNAKELAKINQRVRAIGSSYTRSYERAVDYDAAVDSLADYAKNLNQSGFEKAKISALLTQRIKDAQGQDIKQATFTKDNKSQAFNLNTVVDAVIKKAIPDNNATTPANNQTKTK